MRKRQGLAGNAQLHKEAEVEGQCKNDGKVEKGGCDAEQVE